MTSASPATGQPLMHLRSSGNTHCSPETAAGPIPPL